MDEIKTLVGRTTYGITREMLDTARRLGYEGYLDWQLGYSETGDTSLERILADKFDLYKTEADHIAAFERDHRHATHRQLANATLLRQACSRRQLFERLVEFWNDHFHVYTGDRHLEAQKAVEDRLVIRPGALGPFRDLLLADAKSPAMLNYLDNVSNTKSGPNENYAREVMELHTLGLDGGYTEKDVKEAARCFTGWAFKNATTFKFESHQHDAGAKQIMTLSISAGGGVDDGEKLLQYLADHDATARHLARKLLQRFVWDDPPRQVIDRVAAAFKANGGDTGRTIKAMFLDDAVRQAAPTKLKRPNQFALGLLRALGLEPMEIRRKKLRDALSAMGHTPFKWPAPDGYPDYSAHWRSTNGFLARFNMATQWCETYAEISPVLRQAKALDSSRAQIAYLADSFVPESVPDDQLGRVEAYAASVPTEKRAAAIAAVLAASPNAQRC